ncbi:MAG: sigma factor-like helix-turn-helix DNA-binding protein [Sphaerospermopsis kisseleviana]
MPNERANEIARRYNAGETLSAIARSMGISRQRVSALLKESSLKVDVSNKGNPKGSPRVDGTTYPLSSINYRLRIPWAIEQKLKGMSSREQTAWLRHAIEKTAAEEFGIFL